MKKRLSTLLILILVLSFVMPLYAPSYADESVKVSVDGKLLEFDVPPTIIEGRTLVPVRAIFEALGFTVNWNGETRTVIGKKGNLIIELPVDNKFARKGNKQIELDVPASIINGRTLVPVRFIAESIGAKVDWDSTTRTVIITSSPKLAVHFIDVGQGDSIFIDYGDYDILIDAGDNDQGQVVADYLKSLGTDDIEIMVATHIHADHIGGLDDVLAAFDVEKIIDSGELHTTKTYEDYLTAVKNEKEEIGAEFIADKDMQFDLGNGAIFKVIELGDGYDNSNNNSVVTMLDYNDVEFLFTGDLEADIEKANLDKFEDIDILKVAHHGSSTSTSKEFLDVIKPEIAVISAGKDNSYGHPHLETLVRLGNYVDTIYGTWKSGNIVIVTDGTTFEVNSNKNMEIPNSIDIDSNSKAAETNTYDVVIESIDLKNEIVIIRNNSNVDIDMTGWKLVSVTGNQTYYFPAGFILKAGATVKIASGKAIGDLKWTGRYIWNNEGDPGELYDNNGNLISKYPN